MALWLVGEDLDRDVVTLTFVQGTSPGQPCGRGALALRDDLEAWCVDQMEPWDRLQTRRGVFGRQVKPTLAA